MMWWIFLLIIPTIASMQIEDTFELIAQLLKHRHAQLATLYTCWNSKDISKLNLVLSKHDIRLSIIYLNTFMSNPNKIVDATNVVYYNMYGNILDLSCDNAQKFLEMDADINKWLTRFNIIFKWIILNINQSNATNINDILGNVKLRMDSEVFIIQADEINDGSFIIYDFYNPGIGRSGGNITGYSSFTYNYINNRLRNIHDVSKYDTRKDMSGLKIFATTVITQHTDKTPDEYLSHPSKRDTLSKLNYALYAHILGIHKFRNTYVPTNTWVGTTTSGIDGGLLKDLWEKTADVSATSVILISDRAKSGEYLAPTYNFGTSFVFRNPSALGRIRNGFFDPFALKTWYTCLFFCVLLAIVLKFAYSAHDSNNNSWSSSILNTFAAFCQQDIETDADNVASRILVLCLMLLSLILYNYYTSSIVSDLINSRTQAFTTLQELVHSNLQLGMEEIAYTTRLFNVTVDPVIMYLRDNKILAPGKERQFFIAKEGISIVKAGGFAYHLEQSTGYPLIAKQLEINEICDLCEIHVFKPSLTYVLATKKSQYKDLFSISYRKMMEAGIVRREMLIWQTEKPKCLSSANVLQIELEQAAPAFFVLLFGTIVSLIIVYFERKQHSK